MVVRRQYDAGKFVVKPNLQMNVKSALNCVIALYIPNSIRVNVYYGLVLACGMKKSFSAAKWGVVLNHYELGWWQGSGFMIEIKINARLVYLY